MERFKTRVRLLTEQLGGKISYEHDGSICVEFDIGSAKFSPTSAAIMNCAVSTAGVTSNLSLAKTFVFDIVDRLARPHLADSLHDYSEPSILQVDDYIREERGESELQRLRKQIVHDPLLKFMDLGGNRITLEYYSGVLVLRDDLLLQATNVIESALVL